MSDLIEAAERLLDDEIARPEARRGACWLARAELEDAVRQHLRARGYEVGSASMRSLLICLEVAVAAEPGLSQRAKYAWLGLSRAAHHHAFELSPSLSEVRHLIDLVEKVDAALP